MRSPEKRTEAEEFGRHLGMLVMFGMMVTLFLVAVWMIAYTAARAVKYAMGM